MMYNMSYPSDLDPRNWRLEVDQRSTDLYLSVVLGEPRALNADECAQLVDVIDAWRAQEQRKHMVLMSALEALDPEVAVELLRVYVEWWSSGSDEMTEA